MHRTPLPHLVFAIVILGFALAIIPPAWAAPTAPLATTVFINEIHYDNDGTDAGEAIEVVAPAGTDLTGWTIVLYNGSGGASYDTDPLGAVAGACGSYDLYVINYAVNGIQNGAPDGMALVDASATVIQFLSYEGTFAATNGPANGMTSTDIGVSEPSDTPVGHSLQLAGSGTVDSDFTWQAAAANTFGACNTGQTFGGGAGDAAPAVASTSPANNATNVNPAADLSISFTEEVVAADGWYDITCTVSGAHPAAATGGPTTFTLNPDADFALGETCTVTVYAAQVTDVDTDDPPDNMASDTAWSFSTPAYVCDDPYTGIYAVQGSGETSPLVGTVVDIEGIVVGDFQGASGLSGFYVQDPAGDGDPLTSDGIFVYIPAANALSWVDVLVGDEVHVKGTVKEFNGVTEIDNVTALNRCGTGSIAPTPVDLPEAVNNDLERYEGMLITFPEPLTASQNYFQGRYGQVTLSSDGRMYNPTNGNGLGDTFELNARRILVLDDGYSGQNPNPIPFIGPDNTLRAGDVVTGLTGTLDYGPISSTSSIRDYRLQPTEPVSFTRVNARPVAPAAVGGNVRVATFNTLNWFYTVDAGPDVCGPLQDQDCRGADSELERDRQLAKLLAALKGLDADVVGLMEIENTDVTALAELVKALNDATAPDTYAYVVEPAPGDDAIKVSLIYKPAVVAPVGSPQNYQTSTVDYDPLFDRPPLAQTFTVVATGEEFTVVVNHFKSKGCTDATGLDQDQGDGQGCWNAKRVAQATALLTFIADLQTASGDPDVLTLGDFNAYGAEDPILALEAGGLVNQGNKIPAADRYSYIFDGFSGALDHILTTPSLDAQAASAAIWHINADEPSVIDYNTEFKPQDLYAADAYRSSDHDPMLLGLGLFADQSDLPLSYGVASHTGQGAIRLGALWTGEPAAVPNGDDETDDGVTPTPGWLWSQADGGKVDVTVTGGAGWLAGWIDWNLNRHFDGEGELVFANVPVTPGQVTTIAFDIPVTVSDEGFPARFRLYPEEQVEVAAAGPDAAPAATGTAAGGEVEDYIWSFGPNALGLRSLTATPALPTAWPMLAGLAGLAGLALLRRRR